MRSAIVWLQGDKIMRGFLSTNEIPFGQMGYQKPEVIPAQRPFLDFLTSGAWQIVSASPAENEHPGSEHQMVIVLRMD